jgi:phosphate transport system substrate-binding protein
MPELPIGRASALIALCIDKASGWGCGMRYWISRPYRLFRILLLCVLALTQSIVAMAGETVRINGSGTGLAMLNPLIKTYVESHPGISFEVDRPLGSSGSLKALAAGALDIAVISKALKPEEAEQGLKFSAFGKTPLAIVAGSRVPVKAISTADLEAIYSGKIRKWQNNENIRIVLRPLEDIDTKILRGLSPGMNEAITQAQTLRGMLTAVTDPESNQMVADTLGSIGTAGLAGLMVEGGSLTILPLNGVMPTLDSLANGSYPLAKEISFVTRNASSESALKFLDFVYSVKGRAIVKKVGVLTLTGGR